MVNQAWTVPGYQHVRELGQGASGIVVLATANPNGTPVAIKYLSPDLLVDPEFRADFRDEAALLADVDDPNVVRLLDFAESAAGAAIVMELVDGASLRELLREHGPTEPEAALVALRGSLLGLGAAHAAGVVHRDYKPDNVLVTADGRSALTDFGVAARAGTAGITSGTPAYMAPEQWQGMPASIAGDVYAAAVTFAECLTGRPPFAGDDLAALRRQHERAPIPVAELPDAVRPLVEHGMAKDPRQRPSGTAEFLTELEAAAIAGYGPGWQERGRDQLARRAALLALLFPLAGGLVGGTAVATTALGGGARTLGRGQALIAAGAVAALVLVGGAIVVFSGPGTPPVVIAAPAGAHLPSAPVGGGAQPPAVGPGTGPDVPVMGRVDQAAVPRPTGAVAGGGTVERAAGGSGDGGAGAVVGDSTVVGDSAAVDDGAGIEEGAGVGEPEPGDGAGPVGVPSGETPTTPVDDSDGPAGPDGGTGQGSGTDGNQGNGGGGSGSTDGPQGSGGSSGDEGTGLGQGNGSTDGNQGNGSVGSGGSGTGIGQGSGTDGNQGNGGGPTGTGGGTGIGQGSGTDGNQGNGGGSTGTGGGDSGSTGGSQGSGGSDGTGGTGLGQGNGSTDGNQGNGGAVSSPPGDAAGAGPQDGGEVDSDGTGIGGGPGTDSPAGTGGARVLLVQVSDVLAGLQS